MAMAATAAAVKEKKRAIKKPNLSCLNIWEGGAVCFVREEGGSTPSSFNT